MNTIEELNAFGQSVWLDNISRNLIESGKLKDMLGLGLRGMTSNPTIFEKAIADSVDYDSQIKELNRGGKSTFEIYDALTVKDIQSAADIFRPVYEQTQGLDGYVSLEINPKLAFNTEDTVKEGKRLHQKVNRSNVMFKVPSTEEGFAAVEELLASGINVNITLIFSLEQYIKTASAYIKGLERFISEGGEAGCLHSVASCFVSRVDTLADKLLEERLAKEQNSPSREKLSSLKGKAAVSNCGLIYKKFMEIFSSEGFNELKSKGANLQRVLWGSTSTKNEAYSDIKYVSELIAKDTVNTMPEKTFRSFLEHGELKGGLSCDTQEAEEIISSFASLGIDINELCAQLLREGVAAFDNSFVSLLNSIDEKEKKLCAAQ